MNKKDEALRLALEALECVVYAEHDVQPAIVAIREALAEQPPAKHRYISYVCPQCYWSLEEQPAQEQEPVALGYMNAGHVHEMQQGRLPYGYVYPKGGTGADVALYTSPPASKPWVGLTDAEFQFIYDNGNTPAGMMEMVEAKLKEKNT